jgi:hypothetical protein
VGEVYCSRDNKVKVEFFIFLGGVKKADVLIPHVQLVNGLEK